MKPDRKTSYTSCWPATEVSLARNSFNSIVDRKKMDVTEVMIRDGCMGRQAEMGPDWCPAGLLSRQLAEAISCQKDLQLPRPQVQQQAEESTLAAADAELQIADLPREGLYRHPDMERPQPPHVSPSRLESPWDAMRPSSMDKHWHSQARIITPRARAMPAWGMSNASRSPTPAAPAGPTRSPTPAAPTPPPPAEAEPPVHMSAGNESGAGGATPRTTNPPEVPRLTMKQMGLGGMTRGPSSARGSHQPSSTGAPSSGSLTARAARSTFCWRPNEQSLHRNSFNSIVNQKKLDVTEVMIRDSAMGRQAEMGANWCPGGLVSRRMAAAMMQKRTGL